MFVFFQEDKVEGEDKRKQNLEAEPTLWEQVELWFCSHHIDVLAQEEKGGEEQMRNIGAHNKAQVFFETLNFSDC